ncbi:MAG: hypothetical protein PHC49_08430 [Desulfuromonadaceae bacterium]|nr:hypothetical protein [Desulfuromonadaceae bacterium]
MLFQIPLLNQLSHMQLDRIAITGVGIGRNSGTPTYRFQRESPPSTILAKCLRQAM